MRAISADRRTQLLTHLRQIGRTRKERAKLDALLRPVKTRAPRKASPHLDHYVSRLFASVSQHTGFADPFLISKWNEIVGHDLADLCWPGKVRRPHHATDRGTLEIIAIDGPTATRLTYEQEYILEALSRHVGPGVISTLRVIQSGRQATSPQTTSRLPSESATQTEPDAPKSDANGEPQKSAFTDIIAQYRRENPDF